MKLPAFVNARNAALVLAALLPLTNGLQYAANKTQAEKPLPPPPLASPACPACPACAPVLKCPEIPRQLLEFTIEGVPIKPKGR